MSLKPLKQALTVIKKLKSSPVPWGGGWGPVAGEHGFCGNLIFTVDSEYVACCSERIPAGAGELWGARLDPSFRGRPPAQATRSHTQQNCPQVPSGAGTSEGGPEDPGVLPSSTGAHLPKVTILETPQVTFLLSRAFCGKLRLGDSEKSLKW